MRIANLSPAMLPQPAMMPLSVMKTCEAMAREGHEVVLFAGRLATHPTDVYAYYGCTASFEIAFVPAHDAGGRSRIRYSRRVVKELKTRGRFDAILGRDLVALSSAPGGAPFALETHGFPRTRTIDALQRHLLRRSDSQGLVVHYELLRQAYLERYPWLVADDVIVAYNGSDVQRVSEVGRPSWWPGRADAMQAGYVGSLAVVKGIGMLLRIAELLPDVDVHLVGGSEREIEEWRREGSPSNVFFHRAVAPSELPVYFAALDCLLAPREMPTPIGRRRVANLMPAKIFEYMAHGKAICAPDTPAVREVLEPDRTAFLLPPGDSRAWAAALRVLAEDKDKRDELGRRARLAHGSRFTWGHRARAILGLFDRERTMA